MLKKALKEQSRALLDFVEGCLIFFFFLKCDLRDYNLQKFYVFFFVFFSFGSSREILNSIIGIRYYNRYIYKLCNPVSVVTYVGLNQKPVVSVD